MNKPILYAILVFLLVPASPALAYVGPGAGLGAIAAALAVVVGLVLLVAGFLYFPIKRFLRTRREAKAELDQESASNK